LTSQTTSVDPSTERFVVPASQYSFDQLADIYNQARVDYIVPMPMNGRRMAEYVQYYDIQLDASPVCLNHHQLEAGVGMLGLRGDRGWVTRLGVIPDRRGHRMGQFITETLIAQARLRGAAQMQLEVIVGNEPAHKLFLKLGFQEVRELLVVRRPPGALTAALEIDTVVTEIAASDIPDYLQQRTDTPSWLDETRSLLNIGNLHGLHVKLPSGETGWVIFQRTPFQLTHFAFGPAPSNEMMLALLYHVHHANALQDTKIENLPFNHPAWSVFQSVGYFEVFRRTEMYLTF
jgi:ribosomal protein S18 acetylase RimI-like enzyme